MTTRASRPETWTLLVLCLVVFVAFSQGRATGDYKTKRVYSWLLPGYSKPKAENKKEQVRKQAMEVLAWHLKRLNESPLSHRPYIISTGLPHKSYILFLQNDSKGVYRPLRVVKMK